MQQFQRRGHHAADLCLCKQVFSLRDQNDTNHNSFLVWRSLNVFKSNKYAMTRNWGNQNADPALKTKREITKITKVKIKREHYGQLSKQFFPKRWPLSNLNRNENNLYRHEVKQRRLLLVILYSLAFFGYFLGQKCDMKNLIRHCFIMSFSLPTS